MRILNIVGNLLFWGGLLVLIPIFEHNIEISRFWAIPVAVVGGGLLLIRYLIRERRGEQV